MEVEEDADACCCSCCCERWPCSCCERWWLLSRAPRTAIPLWGRVFIGCNLLQLVVTIGVNVTISVLTGDCSTSLMLALASLTVGFMVYFAIEAMRTENIAQLTVYTITSALYIGCLMVPPLAGAEFGPARIYINNPALSDAVDSLLLAALIVACTLQV